MLRNKIVIIIVFSVSHLFAQQQDGNKCATLNSIKRILQIRTQKNEKIVSTRPLLNTSIVSKSGKFRIHFDTSGVNMPVIFDKYGNPVANTFNFYVDSVAKTFDYVWKKEIIEFGFPAPPSDNGLGGGNEIDVYIMNQSSGVFGYTDFDDGSLNNSTPTRYTGFINIDNDYSPADYRTSGLNGMLVTAAHEFFHVVQVGNYGIWGDEEFYFYELSAESFEPMVFPKVKDYLNDTKRYFENIQNIPLFMRYTGGQSYQGYERAIFGIFLMNKFGPKVMIDIWGELTFARPVMAVQKGLEKNSTSLEREYSEFSFWNYFTGPKADSIKYYPDAKIFPLLNISRTISITTPSDLISQSQRAFTSNYIKTIRSIDTVYFIISNTNYNDAVNYTDQAFSFQLYLSPTSTSGFTQYDSSIYAKFSTSDPSHWSFVTQNSIGKYYEQKEICFPNPFNPKGPSLLFSTNENRTTVYELTIFSTAMELIYNGEPSYEYHGGDRYAAWNGRDSKGNIVGSGVYIYILSSDNSTRKGKFAVVR